MRKPLTPFALLPQRSRQRFPRKDFVTSSLLSYCSVKQYFGFILCYKFIAYKLFNQIIFQLTTINKQKQRKLKKLPFYILSDLQEGRENDSFC